MKKLFVFALNFCIIMSMLIPVGTAEGMAAWVAAGVGKMDSSSGLFRTSVQIEQAYDLTRLEELSVSILEQGETWAVVLVTEMQLESLARLGFEPQASNDLAVLVEFNAENTPWLASSLKTNLEQASSVASLNQSSPEKSIDNDVQLKAVISSFSIEQLNGIQALPGVDNDADGLTDTQESWWCTDPNNPDTDLDGRTDGVEIQALKDWMENRRASAPGETPWASWPFNTTTCPDKDYDSIPNLAERWELGLNMDLESTDRDRYDDGQELFGTTHCPGSGSACGYGTLPSANHDGILLFPQMPAWVTFPGNHPAIAAYPKLEIDIIPDNNGNTFKIQAATVITTEKVTLEGETKLYSTTQTNGTSTSNAETESFEEFQQYSKTTELPTLLSNKDDPFAITSDVVINSASQKIQTTNVLTSNSYVSNIKLTQNIKEVAKKTNPVMNYLADKAYSAADFTLNEACEELNCKKYGGAAVKATARTVVDVFKGTDEFINTLASNKCEPGLISGVSCYLKAVGTLWQNTYDDRLDAATIEEQEAKNQMAGSSLISDGTYVDIQKLYPITYPVPSFTPTETYTSGTTRGRAQTTTHTQYEEHSVTEGTEKQFSTSWGTATAGDTVHAADLWFSYQIANVGTDYAREICDLAFNVFIGDDKNPVATYYPGQDLGGDACFANFQPGESHKYTFPSEKRIELTLDQLKAIDLGEPVRIVVEDYTLGQDDFYTSDAVNGNFLLSIDDGTQDGDENVDSYLLAVLEGDTTVDTMARFFPYIFDDYGMMTAIWTPENRTDSPSWCVEPIHVSNITWCKHALSTSEWWNIFANDFSSGIESYQDANITPGSLAIIRFNQDDDADGYSNLSEDRLGTDKYNGYDYPQPELIAGLHSVRSDNDVTATLSLLNTGLYDAYGIEAIMVAPDDSITITNNTVGGSGRVKAQKSIVVGSRIFPVVMGTWTGTAKPFSGGYYVGPGDRVYTFTVNCSISGGCDVSSGDWTVTWVDDASNTGVLNFGVGYASPNLMNVGEAGVKLGFLSGHVFNGNTFTVDVHSPRDTLKYTINEEPYTQPVVIVSYNDPQGDHRFIIPGSAMQLAEPGDDLTSFSGQMVDNPGIEIITESSIVEGSNTTTIAVNNPSEFTFTDSNVLLEILDVDGDVVLESKTVAGLSQGPSVVSIVWNTSDFSSAYNPGNDYLALAFWTDYEGNVLNTTGRPLSSFQADPQAQFAMSESDMAWDIGTVSQGTLLQRRFTFANTGEREMLTYVEAPSGLSVSQVGSREVNVADQTSYDIVLNTEGLAVGAFDQVVTIHTSDPTNATRTVQVTGTITEGVADVPAGLEERPLDYAVTVPGPQTQGTWYSFEHPLGPDPLSIHPVKVYNQDYSHLWGVGKYATSFGAGTSSYDMFGDGRDGTMPTSGNLDNNNGFGLGIVNSGAIGTNQVNVTDAASGWRINPGDVVLIHQTQGTNAGCWEMNKATSDYLGGTENIQLEKPLQCNYVSSGSNHAQIMRVPQYTTCNVTGTVTPLLAWNGSVGGMFAVMCNSPMNIIGSVNATSWGYRGGLGAGDDWAWTGEGDLSPSIRRNISNPPGNGGGAVHVSCAGGGHGTPGISGGEGTVGDIAGMANLSNMVFGGGGGGAGCNADAGSGGNGGGAIVIIAKSLTVTGNISSTGGAGQSVPSSGRSGCGGAGGSIFIRAQDINFLSGLIVANAGLHGTGGSSSASGDGGVGRIHYEYCNTISGSLNSTMDTKKLNCYMAEQVEASPTFTRLNLPQSFTTDTTYPIQYGRRMVFTGASSQTSTLRIPGNLLSSAKLDVLTSGVGTGSLTISLDIGNDGSVDYTWTGSVTDSKVIEDLQLAPAFNRWWAASTRPTSGTMDVPVKVTLSKAGQVLLTDLKIIASGSSQRYVQLDSATYDNVTLGYTLIGASGPIAVGLDIGDNGSVDAVYTAETPADPEFVNSTNLSTFFNAYLAEKTGLVNVPIRFYLPMGVSVQLNGFTAQKTGSLDVGVTAGDIQLPSEAPTEGTIVPVTVTLHNTGNLPSGSIVASFYATLPDIGDWYIGSTLVQSVPETGTAEASINWNTMGFTGDVSVKVIVDPYERVAELDETNNTAQAVVNIRTRPDLVVTTKELSDDEPVVNENITITLTETNQGQTGAQPSVVAVYDGDPQGSGLLVGEGIVEVIGGSSTELNFNWVPATTGWHRLYIMTDQDGRVSEYNEANNQSWIDVYVGVAGPLLIDSGTAADPVYSIESGYGYIEDSQPDELISCSIDNLPEETLRRDPGGKIVYQFDHLLPGHYYHLDVTLYGCDGTPRQEAVYVDGNRITDYENLGDGQVHRLSLRLDPALYADRTITVAIQPNETVSAVVSGVNLYDIDYRYADSGGNNDPQYPGNEGYGWLEGTPITTWGTLPYRSALFNQSGPILRYEFDNLDANKRYNVHFTFWQPSDTGRIQKIQIDGVDTSLTVNTGDYLLHQEMIAVPVSAYSADGKIIVGIKRTNASTSAMVNEIALEEETINTNMSCVVNETPYFSETYGSVLIADVNAPVGSVVQATNPRGDTVGCFNVTDEGLYGFMRIYGEDTSAVPAIPGMRAGELVSYKVNGAPAVASPLFYWSDDHAAHNINLNAQNIIGQSILLQPGWNLISFNVEPPAPIVSSVLQSINGSYDRVLGETGIYVPSLPDPFNTLRELHSATGYYLRVNGTTSVTLMAEGVVQPCDTPKALHVGWNWIGAPCSVTATGTALQSISGHYQRVLSLSKTYDPALPAFSTLKNLTPGEGYLIYITDPVILTYPSGTLLSIENELAMDTACGQVSPTPFATLVYGQASWMGRPAPAGSLVEIVTPRGEVAGCGVIEENGLLPLTQVYGADNYGIAGFLEGEPLHVRINGIGLPQQLDFTWADDKSPHWIQPEVVGYRVFLPSVLH